MRRARRLSVMRLDYVPLRMRPYPIRAAMNLSSGFGGKTSCLVLGRYSQ